MGFHEPAQGISLTSPHPVVLVGQVCNEEAHLSPWGEGFYPQRHTVLEGALRWVQLGEGSIFQRKAAEDSLPLFEEDEVAVGIGAVIQVVVTQLLRKSRGDVARAERPGHLLQQHYVGIEALYLGGDEIHPEPEPFEPRYAVQHIERQHPQGSGPPVGSAAAAIRASLRPCARPAGIEHEQGEQDEGEQQNKGTLKDAGHN